MTIDDDTVTVAAPRAPVEHRVVDQFEVHYEKRTIEMVAMPYNRTADVIVRGRPVTEMCLPGAFQQVQRRNGRVAVNRDHDPHRVVGRTLALHPSRTEGLVAEVRMGRTPLADETLVLAEDGVLEPSVSFAVCAGGEHWSPDRQRRELSRLFLDHIALVPEGAYGGAGAKVLAVREQEWHRESDRAVAPVATPNLDEITAWLTARRT